MKQKVYFIMNINDMYILYNRIARIDVLDVFNYLIFILMLHIIHK